MIASIYIYTHTLSAAQDVEQTLYSVQNKFHFKYTEDHFKKIVGSPQPNSDIHNHITLHHEILTSYPKF